MSAITTMSIDGVNRKVHYEWTVDVVASQYKNAIEKFKKVATTTPVAANDVADMQKAIDQLVKLLRDGVNAPVNPDNPDAPFSNWYVTTEMGGGIDRLFRSLRAAGIKIIEIPGVPTPTITLEQAKLWKDQTILSPEIMNVLTLAAGAVDRNRSLQALVELEYVKEGNDLLNNALKDLEGALDTTKGALDILNQLQQLHNKVEVKNPNSLGFDITTPHGGTSTNAKPYIDAYGSVAKPHFSTPITPTLPPSLSLVPPPGYELIQSGLTIPDNAYALPVSGQTFDTIRYLTTSNQDALNVPPKIFPPNFIAKIGVPFTPMGGTGTLTITNIPSVPANSQVIILPNNTNIPTSVRLKYSINTFPSTITVVSNAIPPVTSQYQVFLAAPNDLAKQETFKTDLANTLAFNIGAQTSSISNSYKMITNPNAAMLNVLNYFGFQKLTPTSTNDRVYFKWIPPTASAPNGFMSQVISEGTAAIKQLIKLREDIRNQIAQLIPITPGGDKGTEDSNSLLARLRVVLKGIEDNFKTSQGTQPTSTTTDTAAFSGFQRWMLDNYDQRFKTTENKAGGLQADITFAISAGQSLNDTQKEGVRRYLFIFEEYYKSASAILQKITQIVERMAQGITR